MLQRTAPMKAATPAIHAKCIYKHMRWRGMQHLHIGRAAIHNLHGMANDASVNCMHEPGQPLQLSLERPVWGSTESDTALWKSGRFDFSVHPALPVATTFSGWVQASLGRCDSRCTALLRAAWYSRYTPGLGSVW